jgi:hypothetical protein
MRVLIDIFPGMWIEEAKTETRLEEKDGGRTNFTLLEEDGEPMAPKGVERALVNQYGYFVLETSPLATNYGRKIKSLVTMQTSSPTGRRKCYGER